MATLDGQDGAGGEGESPLCSTPAPVGSLVDCSTGVTVGGSACDSSRCDDGGNIWTSRCDGSGCRCLFNEQLRCSCVLDGQACGSTPSCCPSPFPR
jgi:hypothetical protein